MRLVKTLAIRIAVVMSAGIILLLVALRASPPSILHVQTPGYEEHPALRAVKGFLDTLVFENKLQYAVTKFLDENATYANVAPSDSDGIYSEYVLPYAGTYHGHDAVIEYFSMYRQYWISITVSYELYAGVELDPINNYQVVAILQKYMRSNSTGYTIMQHCANVFTLEIPGSNKILSITEVCDSLTEYAGLHIDPIQLPQAPLSLPQLPTSNPSTILQFNNVSISRVDSFLKLFRVEGNTNSALRFLAGADFTFTYISPYNASIFGNFTLPYAGTYSGVDALVRFYEVVKYYISSGFASYTLFSGVSVEGRDKVWAILHEPVFDDGNGVSFMNICQTLFYVDVQSKLITAMYEWCNTLGEYAAIHVPLRSLPTTGDYPSSSSYYDYTR